MKEDMREAVPVVVEARAAPGVALLTITRPARRNALNLAVKCELSDALERLDADESVRAIVLTGAGGYFVAGTDIAEMAAMTPITHTVEATDRVFKVMRNCRKVLIAAVEGYALGGGCELALACDLIVAADTARLGQPEIRVGIMPGAGGTQRLVRTMGKYQALRLVLTGATIDAPDALAAGMVSEVVPHGQAQERACALAAEIATMPLLAVQAILEVVDLGQDVPLDTALSLERKAFQLLFDTADQREGMQAFLEKRIPRFTGK